MSRAYAAPAHQLPAELDGLLLWPAIGLLLLGLVMVYSSSIAMAEGSRFTGNQSTYFLFRHAAGEIVQHIRDRDTKSADARFAPALVGLDRDEVVVVPGAEGARRWRGWQVHRRAAGSGEFRRETGDESAVDRLPTSRRRGPNRREWRQACGESRI